MINLHDQIVIKKINGQKDKIKFTGKFKKNIKLENNSVLKSIYFLRKKNIIKNRSKYEIKIKKNIPVFSGLGGGSSNAATIIKYFYKKRKIIDKDINYFARYLGSDFKIFFKGNKIIQESFFKIENNSASKSVYFLRKKNIINKRSKYEIKIKKNIPVFSGLGGGSSNAATIIKYFYKKRKIIDNDINYFARYLGSDFKIFFKSNKVIQENFLKIENFKFKHNFYLLIVYPFKKSSTKDIYSKFRKYEKIKKLNIFNRISKLKMVNTLKSETNSLESVIISRFPIIKKVLKELSLLKKCEFSRITGSGSACFGLFLNKKDALLGLKLITKRFPKFWCVLSRTI